MYSCSPLGAGPNSDNSKYWQEDQGRKLERKSEDDLPAAGGSAEGEESQENSQSQSQDIGDVRRWLFHFV